MIELVTAEHMRALEAGVFAEGALDPAAAMEAAGAAVADQIGAMWRAAAPGCVLVLCGPGHNGGDGYVAARHLHAAGWRVIVQAWGPPDAAGLPLSPLAGRMRARWQKIGAVGMLDVAAVAEADIVVDAVFGIGLARPLVVAGQGKAVFAAIDARRCGSAVQTRSDVLGQVSRPAPQVVAVDMPSGVCADTGRVLGRALRADLTVTFGHPKVGQYLADGPSLCGRLVVAPVGLDQAAGTGVRLAVRPVAAVLTKAAQTAQQTAQGHDAHKYSHGHALVLAGGSGAGGAARLAARAALRVGAGLVTLGCPAAALTENAARLDAIMLRVIDDDVALRAALADTRLSAICLGPGLGWTRAQALVPTALADGRPVVLDADGLSVWGDAPDTLFDMLTGAHVLTPHGGEFARLFPDLAAGMAATPDVRPRLSKIDAVRLSAVRAGAVVVLKGPDTVIADPQGAVVVHCAAYGRAAPWLASAGTGDVLAGLIAGLLARGMAPVPAAEAAVWLHAEAALNIGPGLIAEDLPDALPAVFRAMGVD